jgi:hypothetical protein
LIKRNVFSSVRNKIHLCPILSTSVSQQQARPLFAIPKPLVQTIALL